MTLHLFLGLFIWPTMMKWNVDIAALKEKKTRHDSTENKLLTRLFRQEKSKEMMASQQ